MCNTFFFAVCGGLYCGTELKSSHSVLVIVPVEGWEMYRLASMRAVFVDFKSHPYRPDEVLEWARRVSRVKSLYELPFVGRRAQCRKLGATHYVERADFSISSFDIPMNLNILNTRHTGRFDSKFSHICKTNTKFGLLYERGPRVNIGVKYSEE